MASGYVDILTIALLQGEIGAGRRIPCAEYIASVLVNYHIGSDILPPQKTEQNLIAGEESYLEVHTLYVSWDVVLVLPKSQNNKK